MRREARQSAGTYYSLFVADIGTGGVVAGPDGLLEVFLPFAGEMSDALVAQIAARYPFATEENPLSRKAADLLAAYFAGVAVVFELPIDRRGFTLFQWEVYRAVMAIPYGEVRSYSQVAAEIGRPRAARGIGGAMARNPLPVVIPCHRVVGKSGGMTGYSAPGGIVSKLWLLKMEQLPIGKNRIKTR